MESKLNKKTSDEFINTLLSRKIFDTHTQILLINKFKNGEIDIFIFSKLMEIIYDKIVISDNTIDKIIDLLYSYELLKIFKLVELHKLNLYSDQDIRNKILNDIVEIDSKILCIENKIKEV